MSRFEDARILMYSHDTFGLGHLRRCRTIAHALVEEHRGLSVLIISGSTIAGAFDYRTRVDFIKIPSVIKLRSGEYTSMESHIDLQETLKMRQSIIRHTAESFQPDIFIVDKEPMGLRGEVEETLTYLKTRGTTLVLGLRDVMDAPHLLEAEWQRNDVLRKIGQFYDRIWVYGPPEFYDPLQGLDVPASMRAKMDFVGFLQRSVTPDPSRESRKAGDYILVTTGGGGDGADLIHDVVHAYKHDPSLTHKALVVLGPYMPTDQRRKLLRKSAKIPYIEVIEFDNRMEELIAGATSVVSMGGYNTYCEILSFDKPALIVPRVNPREEQLIRARRASELGLVEMLEPEEARDPARMAAALKNLPKRPAPSQSKQSLRLEGLPHISRIVGDILDVKRGSHLSLVKL
ncbi:undecaprenyldiphospho-muramoylpentapeptide beta-N-acetylglucosaminyltransferase [Hartmannibacter diazotrophicus]|uniref:Undecaprenyldiphospho-muramoylpentapeptide beta-N-acetylglucosaminyltransferase n=1 Tax=Hartmannibacter diazotrophicus TaxID=1482074 RepID=A0A2C9DCP8_9HYPH|nr:glycosyltransferase family protein [Hartmannibacter diazotrophicus]SON57385.1 undecaprenyldiphospho-muramoylpentapeptide beta-N-acetylglucosaminyltransferase [Hartmannibacter diazotrophicus]